MKPIVIYTHLLNTCSQLRGVVCDQFVHLFSRAAYDGQSFRKGFLECDRSTHGITCPSGVTEAKYNIKMV